MSDLPAGFVLDQMPPNFQPDAAPVDPGRIAGQVGIGANDALYKAAMALPDASAWVSRKLGIVSPDTPPPSEGYRDFARSLGGERPLGWSPQNKAEDIGRATGTGIGEAMGFVAPFGAVSKTASAIPSVVRSVSREMAAKPVLQAAAAGTGSAVGEATDNPYLGMAANFALPFALHGGQRAVSAAPAASTQEVERRGLLETGREIGANPTAGKIMGSHKLQTVESWLNNTPLPLLGGRVARTEEANRDAWQTAILKTAGIEGETAATPNVTEKATQRIGQQFENLTKGTEINVTPKFGATLGEIKAEYGDRLFEDVQPGLMRRIDELAKGPATLAQEGNPSVTLAGKAYQNIRSDLSRIAGTATKPADRRAAGAMVNALDDMAGESLPKEVMADWQKARQQWRNLLAIKGAVGGANNPDTAVGNIPTAAFGRRAQGNPELERLGQYGNAMVGDKAANTSRTAHHSAVGHMLGGAAALFEGMQHAPGPTMYAAGAAALPYGFDMMMNNPATRALLLSRYRNPSQSMVTPGIYGSLAGQTTMNQQSR